MSGEPRTLRVKVDVDLAVDRLAVWKDGIGWVPFVAHELADQIAAEARAEAERQRDALAGALTAIRDMDPDLSEVRQPSDHSGCPECLRKQNLNLPPTMQMCDQRYRELQRRDNDEKAAYRAQEGRMRQIARRALLASTSEATREPEAQSWLA